MHYKKNTVPSSVKVMFQSRESAVKIFKKHSKQFSMKWNLHQVLAPQNHRLVRRHFYDPIKYL